MEVNFKGMMEQLWDEFSFYVDDDIDSLSNVAGCVVMRRSDYEKLVNKLSNLLNQGEVDERSVATTDAQSDEVGNQKPGHGINECELLKYYKEYVENCIANSEMPQTFIQWQI